MHNTVLYSYFTDVSYFPLFPLRGQDFVKERRIGIENR